MINEEERQKRREEKIARMHEIEKIAETLTDQEVEKLVPESELVKKLPLFIRTIDGEKITAESFDALAASIRRSMAGAIVLDTGLTK